MSIGILPNVNFYEKQSGCKAGDESPFPQYYKVHEQPNEKPKKSFQNGKSEEKGAVAVVKIVGLRAINTSEKSEVSEKPEV